MGLLGISPPAARPSLRQLDPLENPPEKKVYLPQRFALHTAGERAVFPPAGYRCPIATPPASPEMKETREYPGFLGTERSKRGGSSLEMKPGARVACQVTMVVVFLVLLVTAIAFAVHAFQPRPQPCAQCPFDWIGYRGKCYHFSEAERNWTSSQDNCSALGASLAMFDSVEDLGFTMRYKGISEHWVGLSREGEEQPWKWVNHSRPSHLFQVQGGGFCAYLGDTGLRSSQCSMERNWVCTKPALNSPGKGNKTRRAQNLCISS